MKTAWQPKESHGWKSNFESWDLCRMNLYSATVRLKIHPRGGDEYIYHFKLHIWEFWLGSLPRTDPHIAPYTIAKLHLV